MISANNELFISSITLKPEDLMNKLFCTFSSKDSLDRTLETIKSNYTIMYAKIFVLESEDSDEYLCTYNIEVDGNTTSILPNTILLHRKKETSTLYTINSLNALIKSLNNGVLDTKYPINWGDYRNSVLLTTGTELRRLNTTILKIVNL
jgi:hypothetical protein